MMKTRLLCLVTLASGLAHAAPDVTPPPEAMILATDDVYDCAAITGAAQGGSGSVWIAATAGGLVVGKRVLTALDGLPDTRVERIAIEGKRILATTRKGSVYVSWPNLDVSPAPGRAVPPPQPAPLAFLGPAIVRAQHSGVSGTCFATDQGLRIAPQERAERRTQTLALPSANVAALAEDGDALFIGTFDAGLFRRSGAGDLTPIDAKNPNINALAWDRERRVLWAGTARGLVRCENGVNCTRVGDAAGVHALALLDGGAVAAGGEGAIAFYGASGTKEVGLQRKQGLPFRAVWALAVGPDKTLYIGTTSGLFYAPLVSLRTRAVSESLGKLPFKRASMVSGDLPDDWVTALASDGGTLHVGTYNAGIVTFKRAGDSLKKESTHPSLGYVNPAGITVLPSGELAVSTMSGLQVGSSVDAGVFRKVPTLGDDVTGVLRTSSGRAWIATRRGVMGVRTL